MWLSNKRLLTVIIIRWLFYGLVFLTGFGLTALISTKSHLGHVLEKDFFISTSVIIFNFFLVSILSAELRHQRELTVELGICILIAIILSTLINFQMAFVVGTILSSTFLYEKYPFYLKRWRCFFAIKYALDATAIFVFSLFFIWHFVGTFFFTIYFMFYFLIFFTHKLAVNSKLAFLWDRNFQNPVDAADRMI